jgi:uncharacterized Zn finger protein (UPF0148 family)
VTDQVCSECGGSLLNESGDGPCEHCNGSGEEPELESESEDKNHD